MCAPGEAVLSDFPDLFLDDGEPDGEYTEESVRYQWRSRPVYVTLRVYDDC